ncbi:TenA family protein [Suttonella sp. R2A3]|uniref:TenA family protein n=1 Tax=Suttonella sp. R2A3 TaxID=2908648 RepID=UPI001F320F87|nr:TenA family protein [Suttonella sp. R2A3]UJF25285.1 TenA family protein [Suttonella sp. R2A3]
MSFLAFQQQHPQQRFSEQLCTYHQEQWDQVVHHRFTIELGEDCLPDTVFARYLVQDYAFVQTLTKLIAYAIAYAPEMTSKHRLAVFLANVTSEENTYFIRSFHALNIPEADYSNPKLSPAAQAFATQLNDAAATGYAECIIALSVAEWTYRTWAHLQGTKHPERFYLREWISIHNHATFNDFVDWLLLEMDHIGAGHPEQHNAFSTRFGALLDLEEAFFTAAYDEE